MKKAIIFSFAIIASLLLMSVTAMALNGDGSVETPFEITTQEELRLIDDFPDCHFKLMNDIELEGTWIPLCKDIDEGFTGTFDGQGYTVTNLNFNGYNEKGVGFISVNNGTITNLNVKAGISLEVPNGFSSSDKNEANIGILCGVNKSNINRCTAEGTINVTVNSKTTVYVGGISGDVENESFINNCTFSGNINVKKFNIDSKDIYSRIGGISGNTAGTINNSYCIANIQNVKNSSSYNYNVSGYSYGVSNSGTITNCYSVGTGVDYGISNGGTKTACFYDKTVSGLTDTNGEGKTTLAMKMKKTFTDAEWDFENIWAIDSTYNDGYPYLQFEREQAEIFDYTLNSLSIKEGINENALETIPETNSFYAEINLRKNTERSNKDCVMIIGYDEEGFMVDYTYAKLICNKDQTLTLGSRLSNANGQIKEVKAFVWDGVTEAKPLSNVLEYK